MLWNPIIKFSTNLKVLREFVDVIAPFLSKMREEVMNKNIVHFGPMLLTLSKLSPDQFGISNEVEAKILKIFDGGIEINITEDEPGKKSAELRVTGENKSNYENAMDDFAKTLHHNVLLYDSSLISLISFVEWFLSEILHAYFDRHPEASSISDMSISFKDLKTLGSVQDSLRFLIDSKVEDILRGSFEDWLKFFKEKAKLSMSYMEPFKSMLSEVFQRRNVIIHNGGIINSIYMSKVPEELRGGLSVGDPIHINRDYLEKSINLFEKCFLVLAAELWKKLEPNNKKRGELIDIAFDHLSSERSDIAESLSYFTMNDKKLPEKILLIAQMNYWQSLKWQDRFDEIKNYVEESDFSAKDEIFQLAQFALLDKVAEFYGLLPQILKAEKLTLEHFRTWPIFREMRNDSRFEQYKDENAYCLSSANVMVDVFKQA